MTVNKEMIESAVLVSKIAKESKYWGGPDADFYWAQAKKIVREALVEELVE